jgi:hypothetical protein
VVSLRDGLLIAIVRATDDEHEQERLAFRWVRALRRGHEAAERIREQMRHVPCSCATLGEPADQDGCERCPGWARASVGHARGPAPAGEAVTAP